MFVRAAAQVKKAMDATARLGGENFNFWGGREGYAFLPTTELKTERTHAAMFFKMARDYWVKDLKQKGKPLLIEPKPQEPSKHQYDWDVGTTAGFLREFGLEKDFKLNVVATTRRSQVWPPQIRPRWPWTCSEGWTRAQAILRLVGTPTSSWPTARAASLSAIVRSRLRPGPASTSTPKPGAVHRRQRHLRAHRRHGRMAGSEAGGRVG